MSGVWYTDLRSNAGRFVRLDAVRSAFAQAGTPLVVRAAAFAIAFTLVVLAALVIIPIIVFAGVIFLASMGYMKVRRFFGRAVSSLPRDDGRRNVRVRLPASDTE